MTDTNQDRLKEIKTKWAKWESPETGIQAYGLRSVEFDSHDDYKIKKDVSWLIQECEKQRAEIKDLNTRIRIAKNYFDEIKEICNHG